MNNYLSVISQIEALKQEANRLKKEELSSVLAEIRQKIKAYGITAKDLGFKATDVGSGEFRAGESRSKSGRVRAKLPKKPVRPVQPKYRDQSGNTWSGRGKRPKWLVQAISEGVALDSLKV